MADKRIGLRDIKNLKEGETVWDKALPGFGARRQRGSAVAYMLKFRTAEGRQRWFTIGRHGAPYTPDSAREEAIRLLGDVTRKLDPASEKRAARKAATITELCDLYLQDVKAGRLLTRRNEPKRPSTINTDAGRIEDHIKPLLGRMAVKSVTRRDIEKFRDDVASGKTARRGSTKKRKSTRIRGGRGASTRVMGLLGAIFGYALRHGMRLDNPVRGVARFTDRTRERRLSDEEYRSLGEGLRKGVAAGVLPSAVAAARFIAITGWRSSEVLNLSWDELDLARRVAKLSETKTGRSIRPLSRAACDLLSRQPRSSAFVFPAAQGERGLTGFPQIWARKIAPLCRLPQGVSAHTLRHSFASLGGDLELSELAIASLIGHRARSTTAKYVHFDALLLAAADKVADATLARMGDEPEKGVVVPIRQAAG
jgi:integrase